MSDFVDRVRNLTRLKKSVLCVGLDCALPGQRIKNTIPSKYLQLGDENEARLQFCLDIVDQVKDYAVAGKPNQQYILGFTKKQQRKLTDTIRQNQMVSILDYKLNDIADTIESGIFHLAECGYDAITFNPLPGNLCEAVKLAHESTRKLRGYSMGIIVLTLMSNPEATKYMKKAIVGDKPLYVAIAEEVKACRADGCVVGATGHVTEENVLQIRSIVGNSVLFLVPGVGTQKGDPEKIIRAGGLNILINVGRDIIYSDNPKKKAKECQAKFYEVMRQIY
jgi:orotidine-5'-phosphate decarboxylase